jgi:AcrR family transcriptional regulator
MAQSSQSVTLAAPVRGRPQTPGLREAILEASAAVFARHDFHEVLVDHIARECHVGKGTIYRYFASKRELYLAVMFEGIASLRAELERCVEAPGPPVRKLAAIVRGILEHAWERRDFLALIHRIEHKPDDPDVQEWLSRRGEIAALVKCVLESAIAAGEVRPVDTRIATEMLFGMLRGVNRYRREGDTLPEVAAATVEVLLAGIGTPSGQAAARGQDAR